MRKKAVIFDLDNTIYSVHTIGHQFFASLFDLILQEGTHAENIEKIKDAIMRRPFQLVAKEYHFSEALTAKAIEHLKNLTYGGTIEPFEDYAFTRTLPVDKFLVTHGFLHLQQVKIEGLKIGQDFKEIHIVDPTISDQTKKDVFADIIKRQGYAPSEVLVVGDDLQSEIKAAQELGIDAVLYDNFQRHKAETSLPRITDFTQLSQFL